MPRQQSAVNMAATALDDLFGSIEQIEDRNGTTRFRGKLVVADREVSVQTVLLADFPASLPIFLLEPWDSLGHIPHITPWGMICFSSQEGMVLDETRPERILRDAFGRMLQTLVSGLSGEKRWDFVDEFEACWSYLDPVETFYLLSPPTETLEMLDIEALENGGGLVGRNEYSIQRFFANGRPPQRYGRNAVLYLPLEPNSFVQPPNPEEAFWSAEDIREIVISRLSEPNQELMGKVLQRSRTPVETVIVRLPRPKRGESLFAIRFRGIGRVHPLLPSGTAEEIGPAAVTRYDPTFLLGRGGAATSLRKKRVLVVGCGSLGGRIAFDLARSGISSLTLVDNDQLAPENTFRHVLGREYWFKNKADALKAEIERQVPYVTVNAVEKTIEQALSHHIVRFDRFDLVVFAIGNPTIELRMNKELAEMRSAPPAIFAWLEPLGIGGHALLVQRSGSGCFRCLFEEPYDPSDGLYNSASFAAPAQFFGRDLSGCGSSFTPFGFLDAGSTANLAARLSMDALTGRERGNPLLSWKGDSTEFTTQEFKLSDRYRRSDKHLFNSRYDYRSNACPVCGGQG